MYKSMKILIGRKMYKTADVARERLDTFYARLRITSDEYIELDELINTVYGGESA